MLCMSCKYGSGEGHCGLGRQIVEGAGTATSQQEGECSGYTEGVQAKLLSHPMVSIMRGDRAPLGDIPFPVRGRYEAPNTWVNSRGCKIMRPSRYELLILPGERGYDTLTEHIQGGTYQLEWGPCRYTINTSPTTGGPIMMVISFSHMSRWVDIGYLPNVGDYLWWLDPSTATWAVELFIQGLMALHDLHYRFKEEGAYYRPHSKLTPPPVPDSLLCYGSPVTSFVEPLPSVASIYAYHEGTHRYLTGQYMAATLHLDRVPYGVALALLQHWEDVLDSYYTNLQ